MAFEIKIPRLGWTMEEGTFLAWLKKDGEAVSPGDPLFTLETDKAAQEVEAVEGGILRIAPHGPKPGEVVPVGTVLGHLVGPGEEPPRPSGEIAAAGTPAISPRAARRALELGVDWTRVAGSGRGGRIRERDVLAAGAAQGAPSVQAAPLSPMRQAIARELRRSAQNTVPVTLTSLADATALVEYRERLKASRPGGILFSYTEFFIKLAAIALKDYPALNALWSEGGLVQSRECRLVIAVDTEKGLLAPVLHDAAALSLRQISERARDLIERARAGKLRPEEMQGGTFTITNLGAYGIDLFTPVIHYPQVAILGLGRIHLQPAVIGGAIAPRQLLWLSLTFDHCALDGAPAARFLEALRKLLEKPEELFERKES